MQVPVHATSSDPPAGLWIRRTSTVRERPSPRPSSQKKFDRDVDSHLASTLSEYQGRLGVEVRAPRHPHYGLSSSSVAPVLCEHRSRLGAEMPQVVMAVVNKKGSPGASVFCCHLVFFFFSPSTPHRGSVVEFGMRTVVRSAIHRSYRICNLRCSS